MASTEERIGKFLRRLIRDKSALAIAQSLVGDEKPLPPRVPGAGSVSPAALDRRWQLLHVPEAVRGELLDAHTAAEVERYQNNIENLIGAVRVPIGLAGPLRMRGMFASGDYYVPLATTEAALVASYARGCQTITEAGGCVSILLHEGMRRTPGFAFRSLREAGIFSIWCIDQREALGKAAASTTTHGELIDLGIAIEGNHVFLILEYTTGDASGQNMVTIATQAICDYIVANAPIAPEFFCVEANLSGDKKATAHSFVTVRGKKVSAEITLPAELVRTRLHSTPQQMERYWRLSSLGAVQSGSIGIQGHFANALTALYIACGQDPACVAESSVGVTRFEVRESGDLYAAVTLPSVVVGTVGGGTGLPSQRACLEILDMAGEGKARALAELCGALALAGEISIAAALAAGDFTRAHRKLARGRESSPGDTHG
jgi:hydroxymethylglutaryl-CoA reductase (NADPH)